MEFRMTEAEEAAYDRYLQSLKEDEDRAMARRNMPRPYRWGQKLNEQNYFCDSCWDNGFGDGAHPYDVPPCDPIRKRW
jgi:hypothetical protein